MNDTDANQPIFAYGYPQRVAGLLGGIPVTLSGFRKWMRGATPSLQSNEPSSVRGFLYYVPVDILDAADVGTEDYGEYHRFRIQVYDGFAYLDAWTYQLVEDADDYTKATSFTLNPTNYELVGENN